MNSLCLPSDATHSSQLSTSLNLSYLSALPVHLCFSLFCVMKGIDMPAISWYWPPKPVEKKLEDDEEQTDQSEAGSHDKEEDKEEEEEEEEEEKEKEEEELDTAEEPSVSPA